MAKKPPSGRLPRGPKVKAAPKTLVKPLPHGGKPPQRRKPGTKRGPKEETLIIPDIQAALDKLLRKKQS